MPKKPGHGFFVKYRTTYGDGKEAMSTGEIHIPAGRAPAGGWPIVAWAHGTVGLADKCAPSRAGRSERDKDYLKKWLGPGYAILASDYTGLNDDPDHEGEDDVLHPYMDGRTAARNTVDVVRAGRRLAPELSKKWGAVGQSQGAGTVMFTNVLAVDYAPELDYRGAVATGVPAGLEWHIPLCGPKMVKLDPDQKTLLTLNFAALEVIRPDLDLTPYLTAGGRKFVNDAKVKCFVEQQKALEGTKASELFKKDLDTPEFREAMRSFVRIPGRGHVRPVFIGMGEADITTTIMNLGPLKVEMEMYGVDFTYKTYPGKDHSGTMAPSQADSISFVQKLFEAK